MAVVQGYVNVFEASDGGTGDPAKTTWQFFVSGLPVVTENHYLASVMKHAVDTSTRVRVEYDSGSKTMSQARLEFHYVCESRRQELCESRPGDG